MNRSYPAVVLIIFFMSFLGVHAEPPKEFTIDSPTHAKTFTLSDAKGKIVALHFLLKTECPYCLKHTRSYVAKSAATPDVLHIFIKPDSNEEIKKWAERLNRDGKDELPTIYRDADAKLAQAFEIPNGYRFHGEVVHYPALIVLDESGEELFRYVGKSNSDRMTYADFEKQLAAKAASRSSNTSESR